MLPRCLLSATSLSLVAAGVVFAAPASADAQQDFRYCSALDTAGMAVDDCDTAVGIAMGQCEHFDVHDLTWRDAMNTTRDMWGYDATQSATVLVNAVKVYCPWDMGKLPHP